jgi:hypothetical protein
MKPLKKKESKETLELKTGDVFSIPDEWKEIIKDMSDHTAARIMMMEDLADSIRNIKLKMWNLIKVIYPQLKGWACSYNRETEEVKVHYKETEHNTTV